MPNRKKTDSQSQLDHDDILKTLITRFDGIEERMNTMSADLSEIKDEVKPLKELQKDIEDVKQSAHEAFENSKLNNDEIFKLKDELCSAKDTIKALQATCSSL